MAVVIGSTIGSGIFRSPAGIADRIPGPLPLLSIWILGGLFALCGALTLSELASEVPRDRRFLRVPARRVGDDSPRFSSVGANSPSSVRPHSAPSRSRSPNTSSG